MAEFKLIPLNAITSKQYKPQWLIKNIMEQESLGMLFGAPASAKSFLAMDMAFCISAGIAWNGNKTAQGKVVYLAGEGFSGLGKRFKALESKYQMTTNNIYLSELPADLSDKKNAQELYNTITKICPKPKLIILDTLHRNFGSGDENSAKDFGNFLYIINTLKSRLGSTFLLVHHSGHGDSSRSRGSSSIRASLDFEYKITKKDELVTMECTKSKDFEEPKPLSFKLITTPIPAWLNEGKPVESAILESTNYAVPVRKAILSKNDNMILQSLNDVIKQKGVQVPEQIIAIYPELTGKKYIHVKDWKDTAYSVLGSDKGPQAKQKAFKRSRDKLLKVNKIATNDDYYWEVA